MQSTQEIWKNVAGFIGRYMVSNQGNVKSLPVWIKNRFHGYWQPETILKSAADSWGYRRVALRNTKLNTKKVHRLVAQAFLPNPDKKPEVNHRNGIKHDNRVENLEWTTPSENFRHAIRTGLFVHPSGAKHYLSKPTLQFTKEMVLVAEWPNANMAAKSLGVGRGNIFSCIKGKSSTAYGFIWKYKDEFRTSPEPTSQEINQLFL